MDSLPDPKKRLLSNSLTSCRFVRSLDVVISLVLFFSDGTLDLRYCIAAFARKLPTVCLPVSCHVALLITGVDDLGVFLVRMRQHLKR